MRQFVFGSNLGTGAWFNYTYFIYRITMNKKELASAIEHTLLKPDATRHDIKRLCNEAVEFGFKGVCVNPNYVSLCKEVLRDEENVIIVTVISFPLGADKTSVKMEAALRAFGDGADEIDMVMNIGEFKSGEFDAVSRDISEVVKVAGGKPVKVIIETGLLTDREIVQASSLVCDAGASFVKTSTGIISGGASLHHIGLIKKTIGNRAGIKASGGIQTAPQAIELIRVGAGRIGTSAGLRIIRTLEGEHHFASAIR